MADQRDALIGLRFEVSGGLGKMAGRVIGKAGDLYLVQKDGAAHSELLELDDLRSAKFYDDMPGAEGVAGTDEAPDAQTIGRAPAQAPLTPAPLTPAPAPGPAETAAAPRQRLADQIRKRLGPSTV